MISNISFSFIPGKIHLGPQFISKLILSKLKYNQPYLLKYFSIRNVKQIFASLIWRELTKSVP